MTGEIAFVVSTVVKAPNSYLALINVFVDVSALTIQV